MLTLTRGHSLPLRLTIPPLRTLLGFACSVASLNRCPNHYPPGHQGFRHAALVACPLGQGEPSTWCEGHDEITYTPPTSFHLDDRRTWLLPADHDMATVISILKLAQRTFHVLIDFLRTHNTAAEAKMQQLNIHARCKYRSHFGSRYHTRADAVTQAFLDDPGFNAHWSPHKWFVSSTSSPLKMEVLVSKPPWGITAFTS